MNDAERVRDWLADGTLLPPLADVPSSVDLARAIAQLCGAPGMELNAKGRQVAQTIGPADQLVFVLVDGLGWNLIEGQPPGAFLRQHMTSELRAVFPSTTAAALTSFATAAWPGQHAIPGWFTYLPEHRLTATILPFVERFEERPLGELGVSAATAYPYPTIVSRFARAVRTYHPRRIADSEYTRYQRGGTPSEGYDTLASGIDLLIARVQQSSEPTYHYLYTPTIDATAHHNGPEGPEVRAALAEVDGAIARLWERVRGRARLVVSADHGMTAVPADAKHVIRSDDPIMEALIVPPSGEPRAPMFHVRPGTREIFVTRFRRQLGESFALLSIAEAEELSLFGPDKVSATARARIGDFIGIAPGPDVLLYEHGGTAPLAALRGFHAGLSPAEMRIPLIVA